MKGLLLENYNPNLLRVIIGLKPNEIETRKPENDEVVIKIDAAPCNPSDIAFMRGMYNIKKELPKVLGFEGTGRVVEAGAEAKDMIGKRVVCFTQSDEHGTWAEYFVTKKQNCIEIAEDFDTEQAACLFINPFTAYGLAEKAVKAKAKAVVQTAASGQVGIFIEYLLKTKGIKTINIVRKPENIDYLKSLGSEYVISSSDENFEGQLKELSNDLNPTVVYEAVGGDLTGKIFNLMPENTNLYLYGGLSGNPVGEIDVLNLIFKNKTIKGFNLNDWIAEKPEIELSEISAWIQETIKQGKFQTKIQGSFSLDEATKAIKTYIGNMSGGKILFKP
jgi:NADPH2:quinone reductase